VLLGATAEKLEKVGIQTLAIVATEAARARLYFSFRPTRCTVGADPDLNTHRMYGLPRTTISPEIWQAVESAAQRLTRELQLPAQEGHALQAVEKLDGFTTSDGDAADFERHQIQFIGQFLIDRTGIVRWSGIECAQGGLADIDKFPTDDELLELARAL
jgi:hypothetical protein